MSHAEAVLKGGRSRLKLYQTIICSLDDEMLALASGEKTLEDALSTVKKYLKEIGNIDEKEKSDFLKKIDIMQEWVDLRFSPEKCGDAWKEQKNKWYTQVEEFREAINERPVIGVYDNDISI